MARNVFQVLAVLVIVAALCAPAFLLGKMSWLSRENTPSSSNLTRALMPPSIRSWFPVWRRRPLEFLGESWNGSLFRFPSGGDHLC